MKALTFTGKHMFLFIAVAISLYFGVHGYYFLNDPDKWNWPVGLALSTIVLIEIIWLNVFRPRTYVKGVNLVAGIIAMAFCVFLPFLSSWSDFQKLEKEAAVAIQVEQLEYYADNVIPALEDELKALEDRISPRVIERNRRAEIGDKEYSRRVLKNGSIRIYTGFNAASWIPSGKKEKEDFRRVEQLRNQIRQYREDDLTARNQFKKDQLNQTSKIAGLNADVDNGRWSFGFKGILIIALGLFSLYYMYSYSNPKLDGLYQDEKKHVDTFTGDGAETEFKLSLPLPRKTKKRVVKSENMKFVLDRFPDAEGVISEDKKQVHIASDGKTLGFGANAPNAWRDAKRNVLSGKFPIRVGGEDDLEGHLVNK